MIKKYFCFLLIFLIIFSACGSSATENTREPAAAGSFYPADAGELSNIISSYLNSVKKTIIKDNIIGLIVPHAGYVYSGSVAAYAYDQLKDKAINNVIILGTAHRYPVSYASMPLKGDYKTPLGLVPINVALTAWIQKELPLIKFIPQADKPEHSIEVQVPFLQAILKNKFQIIPILLGRINDKIADDLSAVLFKIMEKEKNIIIIASSDLSHYPSYDNAVQTDNETINLIKKFNTAGLIRRERDVYGSGIPELATYQCGLGPIAVLLKTAEKFKESSIQLLDYKNSGDISGKKDQVVGYAAMAAVKK